MGTIVFGATGPVMMPAKRYEWEDHSGPHVLDLSLDGAKHPIVVIQEDGDIHINFNSLTKELFEQAKYPKLGDNQYFTINDILIGGSLDSIMLVGHILELKKEA